MRLKYYENIEGLPVSEAVWEILCQCDDDFFPPLSSRESSSQKELHDSVVSEFKPHSYFNKMKKQNFIVVSQDDSDKVTAFMTFIHSYECEELAEIGPSNYVTTICVSKEFRNQGILKQLYHFMENQLPREKSLPIVSTRTWSTNLHHLHTLDKRDYQVGARLKDHRGKGIDTVYFFKRV